MACSHAEWLLLVFSLLPHAAVGICSARDTLTAGVLFRCRLDVSDFSFNSNAGQEEGAIRSYRLHQEGYAGRPEWVRSTLAPPGRESLILYGTPKDQDVGELQLQVLVQRNDFQTSNIRTIHLTVEPLQGLILLTLDLLITNLNLDEILTNTSYASLQRAVSEVYSVSGGPEPQIITLIDPRDRNIEVPEPPQRIGVVVQFTPGVGVSSPVSTTSQQNASTVQSSCSSSSDPPLPPENFNQFLAYGLAVDWCQYTIQDVATPSPGTGSSDALPTVPVMNTPPIPGSNLVLIVIAVVVGVVICISISILTCVCFCNRRNSVLTLPWTKRFEKKVMLQETKLSVGEVKRTQVLLRHLSSIQDVGVVPEPPAGEERPQSTETACLEYQDMPGARGRDVDGIFRTPPPAYCYDERLAEITRSSTPSS